MNSAILFLTYRRFNTAEKVFESIRQAQPPRLYFASNAPNPENVDEDQRVAEVRALIERIDWPCKLYTLFRDEYLSVKYSIPSAIDWFFKTEEMGIILEDDCLPNQSFYPFCDDLLDKYRDNSSVMMVSGVNFQNNIKRSYGSYYLSKNFHIWGWATWKSRWNLYDINMSDWRYQKKNGMLNTVFCNFHHRLYWQTIFNKVHNGEIETWDYQWNYACLKNNGISCIPNKNLISNIGFGSDSNFTKDKKSNAANILAIELKRPIVYLNHLIVNKKADMYTLKKHYKITMYNIAKYVIKILIKKII